MLYMIFCMVHDLPLSPLFYTMEAQLIVQSRSPFSSPPGQRRRCRKDSFHGRCVAMVATPMDIRKARRESSGYNDNWLDQIAINYLSHNVQAITGMRNSKSGYESLVEAAKMAAQNFSSMQQHQLVLEALEKAFPLPILSLIRRLLPQSKFTRECFAAFTTLFFVWLVGPCKVKESEFNGRREKNVVHIKKCRFLEESHCVGMCINLCKVPSQTFIRETLGMPVNMVPNFEDMSCEMIFGQVPPAVADDPAIRQACYKLCKAKGKHNINCST